MAAIVPEAIAMASRAGAAATGDLHRIAAPAAELNDRTISALH
ncbi:hypothetical protein N6G02_00585 [Cupriavidus gilardii]|nr:hypothetical protein [Cupriavidus gilardii]MCT9012103.1 hypothetical protein [Cupriavidus gilardii]MCT9053760.1 hypothetical protein [Cupriavidus gilardii]MCT9114623.1 hypothetical protein [Cupriavidus gilardii]UXC37235.1 hypothetical protein N4G38_07305 [Cupriavidus gilardii]